MEATQASSTTSSRKAIKLEPESMNFESIKNAVYHEMGRLHEVQQPRTTLKLGKDLYEILNRRLVFRTPAHKELPHFITPFGSLRVKIVNESEIDDDSFVIE